MAEQLLKIRRHWLSRILHLFLLVPFAAVVYPLYLDHTRLDVFLFVTGTLIVLLIILLNNIRPIVLADGRELKIFLFYSQNPEKHPLEYLLGYKKRSRGILFLYSYEHRPVRLHLPAKGRDALISLLKDNDIHEIQKKS